jgi:hypothetical protein
MLPSPTELRLWFTCLGAINGLGWYDVESLFNSMIRLKEKYFEKRSLYLLTLIKKAV